MSFDKINTIDVSFFNRLYTIIMSIAAIQLDRRLSEIRTALSAAERPPRGWIKAIREALGMTTAQLGKAMGLSQSRVTELERAEATRNVTLHSLERAAEALDCRLVYVLVPNRSLEERLLEKADEVAELRLAAVDQTMRLEKQGVVDRKQRSAMKQQIIAQLLERPARLWRTS
jgi:predicted DNA-binding mobile mystery protein A